MPIISLTMKGEIGDRQADQKKDTGSRMWHRPVTAAFRRFK